MKNDDTETNEDNTQAADSDSVQRIVSQRRYRVKVVEMHTDYVWIEADSREEAEARAHESAECEFEALHECEVIEWED